MKISKKVVIISTILAFLVSFFYASLYVLGNNDNANNLQNYQVGLINYDEGNLGNIWVQKLWNEKNFKVLKYNNENQLKKDLSVDGKMQLGISINKDFTKTLKNTVSLTRNANVKFIENSKISQMSTLINTNIINLGEEKLNELVGFVNAPNIANFIQEKVNKLKDLTTDLQSEQNSTIQLNQDVNEKINFYEQFMEKIKKQINEIKKDANLDNLRNILTKFKENNLSLQQFKANTPLEIINKILNLQNLDLNKFIDSITDENLKKILNDYIQSTKNSLFELSKTLNSSNSKIDVIQIIKIFNKSYEFLKRSVSKLNLDDKAKNDLSYIDSFKSQLDLMLMNLQQINFKNTNDYLNSLKNESLEEFIKKIFNVDLNEIENVIQTMNNSKNKSEFDVKVSKLKSGLLSLENGITKFVNSFADIQNKFDFTKISKNSDKLYMLAQNPGNVQVKNITTKQTSGQAIIAFALMLGLWVLTLFTYEFILVLNKSIIKKVFWGTFLLTLFAIVHSMFITILNVYVSNIFAYIFAFNLIGWTFYMIQLLLYKIFAQKAAVFLTMIFILMVVGSGATVPIELMSGFYTFIYQFDPLHYCVNIIRELTHNPDYVVILKNSLVVAYYFVVSLSLILIINLVKKGIKHEKNI